MKTKSLLLLTTLTLNPSNLRKTRTRNLLKLSASLNLSNTSSSYRVLSQRECRKWPSRTCFRCKTSQRLRSHPKCSMILRATACKRDSHLTIFLVTPRSIPWLLIHLWSISEQQKWKDTSLTHTFLSSSLPTFLFFKNLLSLSPPPPPPPYLYFFQ